MTTEEYKELEDLLGKLQTEVRGKICIIPGHIHDGYHIGLYSSLSGFPFKTANGPTIQTTVESLKKEAAIDSNTLK
jgi:hypothetical protein